MKEKYDVIVVGGGIAGLTSAAYLCRAGKITLLIEKQEKLGGLVSTFWHEGFAFDAGARAFVNSGILHPMMRNLGIKMAYTENPITIGIVDRWVRMHSRENLQDYANLLKGIFPENTTDVDRIIEEIRKIIVYLDVLYGIDNPLFTEDMRDKEYLMKTLLPWFLKYQKNMRKIAKLNEPVNSYLRRFTNNDALIGMIAQHFFEDTPTFFALSYFGLYLDYFYPMGGTGKFVEELAKKVSEAGGEMLTNTSVISIEPKSHQVVLSDGQKVSYKQLVWAADQSLLYRVVSGVSDPKVQQQRALTEAAKGSDSIYTLFLAADLEKETVRERVGTHAFYTPDTQGQSALGSWAEVAEGGTESLLEWVGTYLEKTTYEISSPSLRDPSLAPEGKTGMVISSLMDYSLVKHFLDAGQYEEFKQFCNQKIIEVLEKHLLPDLGKKTLFSFASTPLTIERRTGSKQGAIVGWAFTNPRMPSENRFKTMGKSIRTPIPDVFQCGQWTFSPAGVPISVMTGKMAADAVIKALKR